MRKAKKKNVVLPSATDSIQKLKKNGSGKHPILLRLDVFWEKWWNMHPNLALLGAFHKKMI